ncbi:helix-turn-helix protein [Kineococcus xinjiangensis]|uniref:Helix-turn-helix protein n=1 Tax=Kineococcus xinjiangensis TaxID=512762 RepID=A0A2S6ICD3_9ACTN|nr:helix-turn-helix domain-containing protein [Kineococcus xinjiangensis]PPK90847.1 helix-turn-helix protein [Kineococcus xinjiangensis]
MRSTRTTTPPAPSAVTPITTGSPVQPFDGLPVLISVPRAALILGLSRASAYRLAASGALPTRRLAGRVYVVTAKLAAFVNGEEVAA